MHLTLLSCTPFRIVGIFINLILLFRYLFALILSDSKMIKHMGKSGFGGFALSLISAFLGMLAPAFGDNIFTYIIGGFIFFMWAGMFYIWLRFDFLEDDLKHHHIMPYILSVAYQVVYLVKTGDAIVVMIVGAYWMLLGYVIGILLRLIYPKYSEAVGIGLIYPVWSIFLICFRVILS